MPEGSHEPRGAHGVLVVLWEPHSAPRLWGSILKWQQHGCILPWGWEMLCPLATLHPTMKLVSGWCIGPAFWVNFMGSQELGLAPGDIWGNGCHGDGAGEGQPNVLDGLWGGIAQPSRATGGCSLSPSHL